MSSCSATQIGGPLRLEASRKSSRTDIVACVPAERIYAIWEMRVPIKYFQQIACMAFTEIIIIILYYYENRKVKLINVRRISLDNIRV